jgi:hypothetical protein
MISIGSANMAKWFYTSTCPICREPALEAYVSTHVFQYECSSCGGYTVTAAEKSTMNKKPEGQRKEWLAEVRRQAWSEGRTEPVDAAAKA